jgi:serine/threonine-protein kinase
VSGPTQLVSDLPCPFGRFTLERRLGVGGMAEVFVASDPEHPVPGTELVLKRILPHLEGNERYIDMFMREGHVARNFKHDNVVRTYELGVHAGAHYIVMEYVEGLTLKELAHAAWAHDRPIPIEVTCQMIADGALGLAHVHGMDHAAEDDFFFVHRDISPDNLIVSTSGVSKVLDFGIAKPGEEDGPLTKTGELKGKIPFMSPEQVGGEEVDGRTDLYSLGVSLYWLLSKERPYDKKSDVLTLNAILGDEPAPLTPWKLDVPDELVAVLDKMIERSPDKRYQSGTQIVEALQPWLPADRATVAEFVASEYEAVLAARAKKAAESPAGPTTGATATTGPTAQPTVATIPLTSGGPQRSSTALAITIAAGVCLVGVIAALAIVLMKRPSEPPPVVAAPPPSEPAPAPEPTPPEPAPDETAPDGTAPDEPAPDEPAPDETAPDEAAPDKTPGPAMKTVKVQAPARIVWLRGKKKLGTGSRTLRVPKRTKTLTAFDPLWGVRTSVPVASAIDYGKLPNGKVAFRITPYAEVFLGKKGLGTTPFKPVTVKAGSVRVRLVFEGKEDVRTVKVPAGGTARVKAKMGG